MCARKKCRFINASVGAARRRKRKVCLSHFVVDEISLGWRSGGVVIDVVSSINAGREQEGVGRARCARRKKVHAGQLFRKLAS